MHTIGCVACHEPDANYAGGAKTSSNIDQLLEQLEPEEIERMGLSHAMHSVPSVPLPSIRDKYTAQGLSMFLYDPASVRPAGRMPGMKLRTTDAADIAAYLMTDYAAAMKESGTSPAVNVQAALRDEGKRLFSELGCVQCHSAAGVTALAAGRAGAPKPLSRFSASALKPDNWSGCLSASPANGLPYYLLDSDQRTAIANAIAAEQGPPANRKQSSPEEQVQLQMMQLNCYACHQREKLGGVARGRDRYFETVGQVDLGDEGRLPPPLTNVGRKLTANWLKVVLAGNGDVRPHLQIRMPKYPASETEPIQTSLIAADGGSTAAAPKVFAPDKAVAEAGRALFNQGCVQCHPVRGESLPAVVGVEIGRVQQRIQQKWFHDFLLNPASLKPRTRMPTFFAPESVNKEILGGDVEKQVAALWAYLQDIDRQPLPEKIEDIRRQNFELTPKERPIVLRTFMQLAGTHAIAVGFPQQVHYAFDAESVRLAELWGGRFLDAQGTWNDRFAPPAMPLSPTRIPLPTGADFAILANRNAAWPEVNLNSPVTSASTSPKFLGYKLDKAGIPAFQYRLAEFEIVDRLVPAHASDKPLSNGFVRELKVARVPTDASSNANKSPGQLWFRLAGSSKELKRSGNTVVYASGLNVTWPGALAANVFSRTMPGQNQLIVPVPQGNNATLTIEYRWK